MSERPLLDTVNGPEDVKDIDFSNLPQLAEEIRGELLDVVSSCGGHLASNLGSVELTIALLRAFQPPRDRILWDTSHQTYTYKLLTGRRDIFQHLRQFQGCCGFLNPEESVYDSFGAGHAGTALSAALGFAVARDRSNTQDNHKVLAVVGDGALGTGVTLEGLNSIIENTNDFILVINDNKMSISPNVGALSHYLNRIISGRPYNQLKRTGKKVLTRVPVFGNQLQKVIGRIEEVTKGALVPGTLFEELGMRYIGPLNGHSLTELTETFTAIQELQEPLVVHAITEKGRGYPHASEAPEVYHGTSKFDVATGTTPSAPERTFSEAFGSSLFRIMQENNDVVAITAGMTLGTGLKQVQSAFPDRFFDVGIAEEHAVVFAAGMAAAGWRPVVAVYATFVQRAMDYVFHDVALQNLPVTFALDRAGVVTDGPTHHGVHDIGFWQTVPGISVLQPCDEQELDTMLTHALQKGQPAILRYPKAPVTPLAGEDISPLAWGQATVLREGSDASLWAVGGENVTAMDVAESMAEEGYSIKVINPRFVIPVDEAALREDAEYMPIITLENHTRTGGFATIAAGVLENTATRALHLGWPKEILAYGKETMLRRHYRLDAASIIEDIKGFIDTGNI